jgi:hypothetical protein
VEERLEKENHSELKHNPILKRTLLMLQGGTAVASPGTLLVRLPIRLSSRNEY